MLGSKKAAASSSSCSSSTPAWSPRTGYSPSGTVGTLQEQTVPAWVPRRVTVPARKPASVLASLHRLLFLPGVCSCMGSPWSAASFRAGSSASEHIFHGLQRGYMLQHGPLWTAGRKLASPQPSPWTAGKPLSQSLNAHLSFLLLHWCLGVCFPYFFHSFLSEQLCSTFNSFLFMLSRTYHHHLWRAQLWLAMFGAGWKCLCLTWDNFQCLLTHEPPLQLPCYQNVAT